MHHHAHGRNHSIKIAGSTVHYWVYGPSSNAPVIVAVHGFRGTHHGLERILSYLPNYTVIVPDLPGFGESTPMQGRTHDIDGYSELLSEFIPIVTRPNEPVYLLGHSFGSIIAAKIASEAQLHFNGLILINPIARKPPFVGRLGSIIYFWLGDHLGEDRARRYFAWPVAINAMSRQLTKTKDSALRRYIKHQHLAHFSEYADRRMLRESFKASVSHTVSQYASRITIPTLLIAGARDEIAPLKSQSKLYVNLTAPTELAIIENVGHLVHYETPSDTADYIKAFIED